MIILQIGKICHITILQIRENGKWWNYQCTDYTETQTQTELVRRHE